MRRRPIGTRSERRFIICLSVFVLCLLVYSCVTHPPHGAISITESSASTSSLLFRAAPSAQPTWPELEWNSYMTSNSATGFLSHETTPKLAGAISVSFQDISVWSKGVECAGEEGRYPCSESIYLAQQAKAFGEVLLRYLEKEQVEHKRAKAFLAQSCEACDVTPYIVDKRCAAVCRRAMKSRRAEINARCFFCSHWGVSVKVRGVDKTGLLWSMPLLAQLTTLVQFFLGTSPHEIKRSWPRLKQIQERAVRAALAYTFEEIDGGFPAMHSSLHDAGSGGGLGVSFVCDGQEVLSFGGGGGGGVAYQKRNGVERYSFGGGLGGGIQFFNETSMVFSNGGGGGGGIQCDLSCNASHCSCLPPAQASIGTSFDRNNSLSKELKLLKGLRQKLRTCWQAGLLEVTGSGGAGGGLRRKSLKAFDVSVQVSLELEAYKTPCSPKCYKHSDPVRGSPLGTTGEAWNSTCNYEAIAHGTQRCVSVCVNATYVSCTCPCFVDTFLAAECSWAKSIRCTA